MLFFFPLPSVALAVMVTVLPFPAFLVVTTPLELTVAYFVLLDFHVSFLFKFLVGLTVARTVTFLPAFLPSSCLLLR